ncbi:hypothetical protein AB205_0066420, partial [Aquarana catesbeiana]
MADMNCYYVFTPNISFQITAGENIKLTINAKGIGFALLQLHVIYNVHPVSSRTRRSADIKDPFSLGIIVHDDKENINTVTLNVCTR